MPPKTIFLDLDDVCNQFTMYALRYVGCEVGCDINALSDDSFKPEWGFDIIKAANALHPNRTFTKDKFWNSIDRLAWATVPRSEEFAMLLPICAELVGRENVCLLSSPTRCPDCLAGKLEWIHSYCPAWLHRQYLIGPRKYFCARPGAILIDDSDKNVREFRARGGQAVLVPRPWNVLHNTSTMPHIKWALKHIFYDRKDKT